MAKVLFSVISGADPISYCKDGPMLHLCRWVKPDVTALFLSGDFLKYHRSDDRYRKSILELGKRIGHEFEILIFEEEGLENPHVFDAFYDTFEKRFNEIFQKYGDDTELIVNLSSGTPAMQACLATMAINDPHKIILKQVSVAKADKNRTQREKNKDFDFATYWETDEDNEPEQPCRVIDIENEAFNKRVQKELIAEHVRKYDYHAAMLVADSIRNSLSEELYCLLKIARWRVQLNSRDYLAEVRKMKDKIPGIEGIIPYRSDSERPLYEYLLSLSIKLKRQDFAELVFGVTPMLFNICLYALKTMVHLDVRKQYCTLVWGKWYLDSRKLNQDDDGKAILVELSKRSLFERQFLASWQMIVMLEYFHVNEQFVKTAQELRKIEEDIRNDVAHDITAVTDEIIYGKTGWHAEEIVEKFRKMMKMLGFDVKSREKWGSYEIMNDLIISRIKR